MRIVLDTNVLLSALIADSATRRIILESKHDFYYPEEALQEVAKHRELVLKKASITGKELDILMGAMLKRVEIVPVHGFPESVRKAEALMRGIDPDDAMFVALALAIPSSAIWSHDKHLRAQKRVRVVETREFMQ